jgi:hypothetical protein
MKKHDKLSIRRVTVRALSTHLGDVVGGVLPPTTTQASNVDDHCRSQAYRSSLTTKELVYPDTTVCVSVVTVC